MSDEFNRHVENLVLSSFASLGITIASNANLFETMMALKNPKTLKEIADAGGYRENYLQELLTLLVVSKIVVFDPSKKLYSFPSERLAAVKKMHGIGAYSQQYNQNAAMIETGLMKKNKLKEAAPPDEFWKREDELFELYAQCIYNEEMVTQYVKNVPGLKDKLESGASVISIGCGKGDADIVMATLYPKSQFLGTDINEKSIAKAKETMEKKGLKNLSFRVMDALTIDPKSVGSFDFVFSNDCFHHLPDIPKAFKVISELLKPGCYFSAYDVDFDVKPEEHIGNLWVNYGSIFMMAYLSSEDPVHGGGDGAEEGHCQGEGHHQGHGDGHSEIETHHGHHHRMTNDEHYTKVGLELAATLRIPNQPLQHQVLYKKK